MAKRNVAYVKPQEPSFLTRLKEEAGYIEGDTIETKRQPLPAVCDEDVQDREEEQPVVVVLKPGDLSAEEAEKIRNQHKEAESLPANLDDRIMFRAPTKTLATADSSQKRSHDEEERSHKRSKVKKIKNASLLSFDQEEDDDES